MYVILTSKPGQFRTEVVDGLRPLEAYDYRFYGHVKAHFVIAELVEESTKIRVVEDDSAIVDLLRIFLESLGHRVFAAMDATGGMTLAAREKPDLITLDFQMPAGDGAQMYKRLRSNTFTAETKIIFISGRSEHEVAHAIPSDPGVRFLPKPIDVVVLKRLIAELLEGETPAAALPSAKAPPVKLEGGAFGGDSLDIDRPS